MNYLVIHHNFPGQYQHVVSHLVAQAGNRVVFITQPNANRMIGVEVVHYRPARSVNPETHAYLHDLELGVIWGQAVYELCLGLRAGGFRPDIIIGHNGWGETLFVKTVWPDVPLLAYLEFFYRLEGADNGFDPELPVLVNDSPRLQIKNALNLLGAEVADWGQTPTSWQASLYPPQIRAKISVIHEGVNTDVARPDPEAWLDINKVRRRLTRQDEVITYVTRNLEPYRGFHVFMRALPEILRRRPRAHVLILGGDEVSYGPAAPPGTTYKELMLAETADGLDMRRVHFLGKVPHTTFVNLLQISSVHIYLTYPFVLSWSLMEAMASGCLVIGSATAPVQEVIRNGENGLLVNFFDRQGLCACVDAVLDHPDRMQHLRDAARQSIINAYDLKTICLPRYLDLIASIIAASSAVK